MNEELKNNESSSFDGIDDTNDYGVKPNGVKHVKPLTDFNRVRNGEINARKNFSIVQCGTVVNLVHESGDTYVFIDRNGLKGKGFHIVRPVKRDVESFIQLNPDYDYGKYSLLGVNLQKVNLPVAKKHEGNVMYAVDVDDCYWDTMYKRGFITQKTYLSGLKQKDWKVGRNASIGALDKTETISVYEKGILKDTKIIDRSHEFTGIRAEIVGSVHEMFMQLIKELGDKYIMYFTDCVYVTDLEAADYCKQFFRARSYGSKLATYQLDQVDGNSVYWYDFKKDKSKSYTFGLERDENGMFVDPDELVNRMKPISPNKNF